MPTPPPLEVRRQGDQTTIRFPFLDRLDEYNSDAVGQELSRLAAGFQGTRLVLDLGGIRYVTSSALGKLVGLHRQVRSAGGVLALANLGPAVGEALAVTHLDEILEVIRADGEVSPGTLSA